jgi:hypothetical protein
MDSVAAAPDVEQPSVEERRALIERVAASEQISRSARLRDFLLYVGLRSLKADCAEIHEQEIGARVFGRPASYDRSQDNIVRVNATELRKRIDTYFSSAGADEKLIFQIPPGGYKPVFRWRVPVAAKQQAVTPVEPVPTSSPAPAIRAWRRAFHFIPWPIACAVLAVAAGVLLKQNLTMRQALRPWVGEPAVAAFWTEFLDTHRQTDIVLPDDAFSLYEDMVDHSISLEDYLDRDYVRQAHASTISPDRKSDLDNVLNHNLVTFGAVRAAQLMFAQIPSNGSRYLTLSRYFTADQIKRDNVILIGGRKSVPWDHLYDDQINFMTDFDYAHGLEIVTNRNPQPGEQAIYTVPLAPNSLVSYAVVAFLPNPSRTGNSIILAGTDSDATGAAGAFLTSEEQMERFRKKLHVDRFPYFEVLLKTSRLSGTFFDAKVIAYRTYPK